MMLTMKNPHDHEYLKVHNQKFGDLFTYVFAYFINSRYIIVFYICVGLANKCIKLINWYKTYRKYIFHTILYFWSIYIGINKNNQIIIL